MLRSLVTVITLLFILNFTSIAQEIIANVTVNMERVEMDNRHNVQTLKNDLENYINNNRFTNIEWEGPRIPVEISIVLSGGYGGRYNARLLVISKRIIDGPDEAASVAFRIIDDKWSFEYAPFASHNYNLLRYNQFTTLIDFYMLLVIGFDLDTYEELGGNSAFELAKQVFQLGASIKADGYETISSPGTFNKFNLISELNDIRYYELRKLIFAYYVDGLDKMASNKNKALEELDYIISEMAKFKQDKMTGPSVLLQVFMDSKSLEMSQLFKDYPDKSIYDNLIYLDPANAEIYRKAKEGRY